MKSKIDEYAKSLLEDLVDSVESLTDNPKKAPRIAAKLIEGLTAKASAYDWAEHFEDLQRKRGRLSKENPFENLPKSPRDPIFRFEDVLKEGDGE